MSKPLIGVTPWYDYEKGITFIKKGYMEGVLEASGLPVLMPLSIGKETLDALMMQFDGFLLTGGPDVDAKYFGEANMPFNGEISPLRDSMEIYIAEKAVEQNKPLFGICRGVQIMNVALGGTLFQDIRSQVKDREVLKHSQEAPRWYPTHDILIEKGSKIQSCLLKDRIGVNSFHHQAVKDIAPGFEITSRAADGIIESIEHAAHKFAVGVQWHPELMWQEDPTFINLFRAFIQACS